MASKQKNKKYDFPDLNECTIAIIGLGYVGLPLAIEFSKNKNSLISGENLNRKIIGFDTNEERLHELRNGIDKTNEIDNKELLNANFMI